jgi:tRNA(His) 5'-end guanylyltransferase
MAARAHFSHKQLDGKHGGEMQAMLRDKGVEWNDFPAFFKRGTYVQRRKTSRRFTTDELEKLPPKHAAHTNPDLVVERTDYAALELPPLGTIKNRVEVIFEGAEPVVADPAT